MPVMPVMGMSFAWGAGKQEIQVTSIILEKGCIRVVEGEQRIRSICSEQAGTIILRLMAIKSATCIREIKEARPVRPQLELRLRSAH